MSVEGWVGIGIPEEICEQAMAWISRLDSDEVTLEERQDFMQWLDADPMHRWAYEEISEFWARFSTLKDSSHQLDRSRVIDFPTPPKPPEESAPVVDQVSGWQSVAALLLIVVGLAVAVFPDGSKSSLDTGYGEVVQMELEEGSTLTLNAETKLQTQFSSRAREVWLEQGELLVNVEKEERPFVVHAGPLDIVALGTEFHVSRMAGRSDVAVVEGRVRVYNREGRDIPLWEFESPPFAGEHFVEMGPGEIVTAPLHHKQVGNAEVLARLGWRNGELLFSDERLDSAVADVVRHSGVRINFASPELAELRVSGRFVAGDHETFLHEVEKQLPVSIVRHSPIWVVLKLN